MFDFYYETHVLIIDRANYESSRRYQLDSAITIRRNMPQIHDIGRMLKMCGAVKTLALIDLIVFSKPGS